MLALFVTLQSFVADRIERGSEKGATAVEYGLMVALVAAVIVTVVALLGDALKVTFTEVKDAVVTSNTK